MADLVVAACLKWAALRPEVDPLDATVREGPHSSGASPADQAALEHALRLAEAWGAAVVAVTAGPPAATGVLREALAAGAARAVRVELEPGAPSPAVAAGLAEVLGGVGVVCCGDASVDRGSGSVPAFLAAHLGAAQALGLVELRPSPSGPGRLAATRRLDRGRRERLELDAPAVVSVEGGSARLRRAALGAVIAARSAAVDVHVPARHTPPAVRVARSAPFRPRPRVLAGPDPTAPARERILALTVAATSHEPPRLLHLAPGEAAQAILDQLAQWGHR